MSARNYTPERAEYLYMKTKTLNEKEKKTVPPQHKGEETGAAEQVEAADKETAVSIYNRARQRLMRVNRWGAVGGAAGFRLTDSKGKPVSGFPRNGNLIRIDLPGPGPKKGKGYDWVKIEKIRDEKSKTRDEEFFSIRVRAIAPPGEESGPNAHFYTKDTTNSFMVRRVGNMVYASVKGRNEIINRQPAGLFDRIRNTLVGLFASKGGSHLQWKSFLKGLLD